MKIRRNIAMKTNRFSVGDIIKFRLNDGEKVQAIAVKETNNGMLFVLKDCLEKEYPMYASIDGAQETSYMDSDLRKALNGEILARFPDKIKSRMTAVNDEGDLLRIPTECEIFGENEYGQEETGVKQWKPMRERRNRIAFQGIEGAWECYWLMNRYKNNAAYFALVGSYGGANYADASTSLGVRPAFLLS